jgi:exonuclease VII large subunit
MPTANTTSPSGRKTRSKRRTSTAARRKPAAARKPTSTATPTAAATRWPVSERPIAAFGDYAERAVLIPVGATLIARDRVVTGVTDTLSIYSSSTSAQAQLRRFERRGATARRRLEREVRKTRTRVEREMRQRRREISKRFSSFEQRRDTLAKNSTEFANRIPELANRVQERIVSLV